MGQINLIDNRIENIALFEINLSIYLGAEVQSCKDIASANFEGSELIIARCKEEELPKDIETPVILITDYLPNSENLFSIPENCDLKQLLKTAAKILGVTAQQMAEAEVPSYFPIATRLFKFLGFAPFPIYKNENGELLLSQNHPIKEDLLESHDSPVLFIDSCNRVLFADSFSTQLIELSKKLQNTEASPEEQIVCLDQTMSVIASRLQYSGMDSEVITLAQESITNLITIASKHNDAKKLIKDLYNNDTTHRYKNSQLLLFITFHVLKTLDWWVEKQRESLSSAAFFHDILFENDEASLIRNENEAVGDYQKLILNHAKETTNLIKNYPEINKPALTIITEHHGKKNGTGFSDSIETMDPLSKLFIICEIYTNTVLSHKGEPFDEEEILNQIHSKYPDEESKEIINALSALELDQIIGAVTEDLDKKLTTLVESNEDSADITQLITGFDQETQDDLTLLRFAADNVAGLPDLEQKKILHATTQVMNDLEKQVVGGYEELSDEQETVIGGVTETIKEVATLVKGCFQKDQKEPLSDARDQTGRTKLMVAALSGNISLLDSIIRENSDLKLTDSNRQSALHYAALNGGIEIIEYLVDKGININGLDAKRRTPLFVAICSGHYHAAKLLLILGAWPHVIAHNGISLGILAANKGNLEILKLLHKYKAPLSSKDHRDKDALKYASALGFDEIVAFLKEVTA